MLIVRKIHQAKGENLHSGFQEQVSWLQLLLGYREKNAAEGTSLRLQP